MNIRLSDNNFGFCIPAQSPKVGRPFSLVTYKLLLRTRTGRLAWCEVKQREAPEISWMAELAQELDVMPLYPEQVARLARGKLQDRFGMTFLDEDAFDRSLWRLNDWLQIELMDFLSTLKDATYPTTLREDLERRVEEHFSSCLHALSDGLNAAATSVARINGVLHLPLYNYLMHVDQATQTARIQALGVFPFLTERILLNGYADIRSAIDARIPLAQALAERFKLPVAMVRKLSRFPAAKLGRHLSKPDILWPLFAKVALERIPSTDEQWIEFELLTQRIYGFTRQPINTELNTDILTQCLSSRLTARVLLGDGWRENQMLLRHFLDAAIGIARYVWLERFAYAEAELSALAVQGALIKHLGLRHTRKLAQQWHQAYREAEQTCAQEGGSLRQERWSTLLSAPLRLEGFVISPLRSPEQLRLEGEQMHNCVGTYAYLCRRGGCQLWSVESETGTGVATLQTLVENKQGKNVVVLGELEAAANQAASTSLKTLAKQFVDVLNSQAESLQAYVLWKNKVQFMSMDEMLEAAYVKATILAMRRILPGSDGVVKFFAVLLGSEAPLERLKILVDQSVGGQNAEA